MSPWKVVLGTLCLSFSGGCDSWPRHNSLPNQGGAVPSSDDLSGEVDVNWNQAAETLNANDYTLELPDQWSLELGAGIWLAGTLEGTGYANDAPELLDQEGCAYAPTIRSPYADGDYTGDVDVHIVTVAESGFLCVDMQTDDDVVFDLLLFPLDACGLPGQPITGPSGYPLGIDQQGGSAHWEHAVDPGSYAIQGAAWKPDDPARTLAYTLALSLMDSSPMDQVRCPVMPEGT